MMISAYMPPQPSSNRELAPYQHTVRKICSWLDMILCTCGRSTTPIIGIDLNDGMGIHRQGREHIETRVVGQRAHTVEKHPLGAGASMRELMEKHHMIAANAMEEVTPIYHGAAPREGHKEHSSMIDFVFVPNGLAPLLQKSTILRRAGRRLQLIPDSKPRDHIPIMAFIEYVYHFPKETGKAQ